MSPASYLVPEPFTAPVADFAYFLIFVPQAVFSRVRSRARQHFPAEPTPEVRDAAVERASFQALRTGTGWRRLLVEEQAAGGGYAGLVRSVRPGCV